MKLIGTVAMVVMVVAVFTATAFAADAPASTSPSQVGQTLGTFLNELYSAALRVVGLAIFVMFLIAGLGMIVPGMAIGKPEAILKDAVIGLVILVSAYVVLNSIHPNLVQVGGWLPEVPKVKTGAQPGSGTPGDGWTQSGALPVESDTITLRSGNVSRQFIKPNSPCGGSLMACQPGYTCQGAVCKWAAGDTIALNSYCQTTAQCKQPDSAFAEAIECVSVYEFRNSPGLVQKCCDGDSVAGWGAGGATYCTH